METDNTCSTCTHKYKRKKSIWVQMSVRITPNNQLIAWLGMRDSNNNPISVGEIVTKLGEFLYLDPDHQR